MATQEKPLITFDCRMNKSLAADAGISRTGELSAPAVKQTERSAEMHKALQLNCPVVDQITKNSLMAKLIERSQAMAQSGSLSTPSQKAEEFAASMSKALQAESPAHSALSLSAAMAKSIGFDTPMAVDTAPPAVIYWDQPGLKWDEGWLWDTGL